MKKALKELIANAPEKLVGDYRALMFVTNGIYDGFWGKNGYDNILILGQDAADYQWYKVSYSGDVFNLSQLKGTLCLDIPSKFGVPVIWFGKEIHIDNSYRVSTVIGKLTDKMTT